VNEHGEAKLYSVELDRLDEDEVCQVARSSIYTWKFTNTIIKNVLYSVQTDTTGAPSTQIAVDGIGPRGGHVETVVVASVGQ
jgi:hypothetical protein